MGIYAYRVDSKTGEEGGMTFKLSALGAWEAILPYLCNEEKDVNWYRGVYALPIVLYVGAIREDIKKQKAYAEHEAEILQMIVAKVPKEEDYSVFMLR